MNFFESRVTEYQKAPVLAPCSDEELVSDIFGLKETKLLTEQLSATVGSAFCTSDAKELVSILQDWAKHTDEKQVGETLCALLRECERNRNAENLRKVLSEFFLALPDPWKARASFMFVAETAKIAGAAVLP